MYVVMLLMIAMAAIAVLAALGVFIFGIGRYGVGRPLPSIRPLLLFMFCVVCGAIFLLLSIQSGRYYVRSEAQELLNSECRMTIDGSFLDDSSEFVRALTLVEWRKRGKRKVFSWHDVEVIATGRELKLRISRDDREPGLCWVAVSPVGTVGVVRYSLTDDQ